MALRPIGKRLTGEYLVDEMDAKLPGLPPMLHGLRQVFYGQEGAPPRGFRSRGRNMRRFMPSGAFAEIGELEEVAYLNDLCNRLGLDTMTGGNLVALIMDGG